MNSFLKNAQLHALREQFVPKGAYNMTPFFIESARGAVVIDVEGRELIDFSGGM